MVSNFWNIPGIQSKQSLDVLAQSLGSICIYNEQGQVVYVNRSFLELVRVDAQAINFFNYFPATSPRRLAWLKLWEKALSGKETTFLLKGQDPGQVVQCSLQFGSDARLMFLTAKPTHRNQAIEQVTQAYETLLSVLFNHSGVAIALMDVAHAPAQCNQNLHDLLGTTAHENIVLEQFIHPDDVGIDAELKQKLINGSIHSYTVEQRLVTKSNDVVWVNASVSLIERPSDSHRSQKQIAVLFKDVTETKKIYDALIRTEGKWKTFALNSPHLFIQTSRTGQIIYASPAVERTLGFRGEELLDQPIADLIHPNDLNEFKRALRQWAIGAESIPRGVESQWKTQSGEWVYLYSQGQPFPLALNIDGIAMSGYNITDRKRLEAQLSAHNETGSGIKDLQNSHQRV
ncbi:PAS domain-containing protein [Oculatella sp. LEGE 06141]|uniref:PAS domain-containing protein n=1 Tax=Oculatella sp. LEGE 06141 TaxID=1828648 RepID=UPI001882A57B|nr:PAS domain-containing protein [Oculatella sp. LEGE 06141]MBE9180082.1 PAS domain-containing protein [Oculatella sp. LEGE 06141]